MRFPCLFLSLVLISTEAGAQGRPFLFTLTPHEPGEAATFIRYDAAYGRGTFEPFGGDNLEQNVGFQARLGESLSLIAQLGMALDGTSTRTSQHGELLVRLLNGDDHLVDVSAGPGIRHEYSGTNVLLGRILLGRRFESWQLYGNMLLEKPLATNRDNIDIIMTAGASWRLSAILGLGIEAVGQDLEGFWDENEAEGGATLFVGPVVSAALHGTPWNFTIGGGMIVRASTSSRLSDAVRDLPLRKDNGFVIRASASFGL